MEFNLFQIEIGLLVGLLVGFSKTSMPTLGIFSVVFMALIFQAKTSVGLLLPMFIIGDLVTVFYYRHKVVWKHLISISPWVVIGLVCGSLVLYFISNRSLQVLIGCIILAVIFLHVLLTRMSQEIERGISSSILFSAIVGILAGFATVIGNAPGAILTIFLFSKRLDKNEFIGTGAWLYLSMNLIKVPLYSYIGLITWDSLVYNLWTFPAIIIGALIGIPILRRIPGIWYQWLVLVLAGIGAFRLIWG